MSRWANENPERMAEIAALPLSQQNEALRGAIGYDPDRIREEARTELREHGDGSYTIQAADPNAGDPDCTECRGEAEGDCPLCHGWEPGDD